MIKKLIRGSFIVVIITLLWGFLDTTQISAEQITESCGPGLITVTSNPIAGGKTQILASVSGLDPLNLFNYHLIILENTVSGWVAINNTDTNIGKDGAGTKEGTYNLDSISAGNLRVVVQHGSITGTQQTCTAAQNFSSAAPAPSGGGGTGSSPGSGSGSNPGSGNAGFVPGTDPAEAVENMVGWLYKLAFPIAVIIGVVKILINLIKLATSQGDPGQLQEVKEELSAILMGLLLIGGAASLINILGSALGI